MSDLKDIRDKLEKMDDALDVIKIDQAVIKVDLKEHMRRTELLEKQLEPVKKHVAMVDGGLKLLGVLSLILGILKLLGVI